MRSLYYFLASVGLAIITCAVNQIGAGVAFLCFILGALTLLTFALGVIELIRRAFRRLEDC